MDDSGVADAFYTLLSIAIVLVAAIAVSGVVLSSTMKQGKDVGDRISSFGDTVMKKGLYGFYYAIDADRSDFSSADPNDIVLRKLISERADTVISFNKSSAPKAMPVTNGAVIWSGYLNIPADRDYVLELSGSGRIWLWLDDKLLEYGSFSGAEPSMTFTLHLTKGYRPLKIKFAYQSLNTANCNLSWQYDGHMDPINTFLR
jgi:hypothetical protein